MTAMAPPRDEPEPNPIDSWMLDLYRSDYRRLVRLATLLLDDQGTAEEVVQDAFVTTARRQARTPMNDSSAAPAYLRSAVLNGARSQMRRRAVRRRHLRSVDVPPAAPAADRDIAADDASPQSLRRRLARNRRKPDPLAASEDGVTS